MSKTFFEAAADTTPGTDPCGRAAMPAAELLIELGDKAAVFHSPDDRAYATILVDGHQETWRVRSKQFRFWLAGLYTTERRRPPPRQALADVLDLIEGNALRGPEMSVHVRVAEHENRIYLDLRDPKWRAVEVDADGWRVVAEVPVKFVRPRGAKELPKPVPGTTLEALRAFLNVEDDHGWVLVKHWLIMALHPRGPYPVLAFQGEQGSGKSMNGRLLRQLVDPHVGDLRSVPREERDLMVAARNSYILAFDNFSRVPEWLSDAMCRLSTGGGNPTRELYTDEDEILFNMKRPVIVNGIEDVIVKSDLISRAILVDVPVLGEDAVKDERALEDDFDQMHPHLLGALLDWVSAALRERPNVTLGRLPRMADFAVWSVASEQGMGVEPAFMRAYRANILGSHETAVERSAIGPVLRAFVAEVHTWEGTATALLTTLNKRANDVIKKQKGWPGGPGALSGALKRLAPNLRALGITVIFPTRSKNARKIVLTDAKVGKPSSPSSPSSPTNNDGDLGVTQPEQGSSPPSSSANNDEDPGVTQPEAVTEPSSPAPPRSSPVNPRHSSQGDDGDGGDARIPPLHISPEKEWL
jgi:hypothetical protein